jgi:hypothetical protein
MRPMTVDKQLMDIMLSIHSEFPVLDESSALSIMDLLSSEDPEVQVTGITLLDTFNYFKTPGYLNELYHNTRISNEIDELDQFALIIRLNYFYSKENKLTEEETLHDNNLIDICKKFYQEKKS